MDEIFSFAIQRKIYLNAIKRKRGLILHRDKDGVRPEYERMGTHHMNISKVSPRNNIYMYKVFGCYTYINTYGEREREREEKLIHIGIYTFLYSS
jgi:hypothetical protein